MQHRASLCPAWLWAVLFGLVAAGAVAPVLLLPRARPVFAVLEIRPQAALYSAAGSDPWLADGLIENYLQTKAVQIVSSPFLDAVLADLPPEVRREFEGSGDPAAALARALEVERVRNSFLLRVKCGLRDSAKAVAVLDTLVPRFVESAEFTDPKMAFSARVVEYARPPP